MMNKGSVFIETKFFLWLRNKVFTTEEENKEYYHLEERHVKNMLSHLA